ncbi:hypothetical protein QTP86_001051 [Hemibagrus guttatus]|nr:hypothetical protein QTP86_001051 [Hemibagrus guttatus]
MAATKLPPHRPWDCAIDLLPGAKLPKGRVYPLSIPENKAMEEYISEALQQGFIQPSTSPAASSFFFVAKKAGGLRPCINYHVLNSQTVKFAYLLPLVPAALEELRRAHIFSKLDLLAKLVPLHIPCRPWSHMGIDFATDLPVSNGFTTILITVDRFSKACKLILLKGLPTALETAEALFSNIFRHFSIPEDIVSDRGPQFISSVW